MYEDSAKLHTERAETILDELRANCDLIRKMFHIAHHPGEYKEHIVGESKDNKYLWANHFQSKQFGLTHYGLKIPNDHNKDPSVVSSDYLLNVVFTQILIEKFGEDIVDEFPMFYGVLTDKYGKEIATISQDFSEGGRYKVSDSAPLNELLKQVFYYGSKDT